MPIKPVFLGEHFVAFDNFGTPLLSGHFLCVANLLLLQRAGSTSAAPLAGARVSPVSSFVP